MADGNGVGWGRDEGYGSVGGVLAQHVRRPGDDLKPYINQHGSACVGSQHWKSKQEGPEVQMHSQLHGKFDASLGHTRPFLNKMKQNVFKKRMEG